jgi:hypothetical protein
MYTSNPNFSNQTTSPANMTANLLAMRSTGQAHHFELP